MQRTRSRDRLVEGFGLPAPRPTNGLKPVSSAKVTYQKLDNGQLKITLLHDLIKGVTSQMLLWWFAHITGTMGNMGGEYPRYFAWHPYDHVLFEVAQPGPGGEAGQGATWHIIEVFGRNPDYLLETMGFVEKLDETGITLVKQKQGVPLWNWRGKACHSDCLKPCLSRVNMLE